MMAAEGVGGLEPQCRGRWEMRVVTLKRRSEFLRVRGGARWSSAHFVLEARPARDAQPQDREMAVPRFGFTITKKLGGAVTRNRIRRRLKEAVGSLAPEVVRAGYDYVLIARIAALTCSFEQLRQDLGQALKHVHTTKPRDAAENGTSRARGPRTRGRNHRNARASGQTS